MVRNSLPHASLRRIASGEWHCFELIWLHRTSTDRTPGDIKQVHSIILESARQPDKAALFNHASMAYNNHFFFNGLVRISLFPHRTDLPRLTLVLTL